MVALHRTPPTMKKKKKKGLLLTSFPSSIPYSSSSSFLLTMPSFLSWATNCVEGMPHFLPSASLWALWTSKISYTPPLPNQWVCTHFWPYSIIDQYSILFPTLKTNMALPFLKFLSIPFLTSKYCYNSNQVVLMQQTTLFLYVKEKKAKYNNINDDIYTN